MLIVELETLMAEHLMLMVKDAMLMVEEKIYIGVGFANFAELFS